jgi:NAD(P)-dependent dehydrogenase (short-subunit alcohol dehydrogenase family)
MSRFDGKVALITGATSGISRATALAFAFAFEGASVVVADIAAEEVLPIGSARTPPTTPPLRARRGLPPGSCTSACGGVVDGCRAVLSAV